jgi:hypothetical protein
MIRLVALAFVLWPTITFAQSFECVINEDGGIDLYGTNNISRVLRCTVTCSYWHTDGSEGFERCQTQMQPDSPRTKYCSFNRNDAKTIIGASHDCH